jgi:hypothetical protein
MIQTLKRVGAVAAVSALLLPSAAFACRGPGPGPGGTTVICHHGPNGTNTTVTVPNWAVPFLLKLGDTVGPCPTGGGTGGT